ncbi:Invasion associated protein p60 [hydrothermal vent metagenome]|uniref:Invasion associated protein p60 n=1 Tax=hydrothermal vent metagenome TaxID=652676 RepID=A0A1W1CAL5_9ZZZZ
MNLIRNVLLSVLFLQFLGFLYVKFIYEEENKKIETPVQKMLTLNQKKLKRHTVLAQKKPLPISTKYTDNGKKAIIKVAKSKQSSISKKKIQKNIKIVQVAKKPKTNKKLVKKSFVKVATAKQITSKKKNQKEIKIVQAVKKPKTIVKVYKKVNKKLKLSAQIEKYAKKMLGKKYVWGATGPKCYDCSGFTQKVYRKVAGIKLPRVSYLQAKVGKRISFKKLKQGDMVFFDTEKKRTGKVNHVGIYLRNGNFIHASSGGKKVMITNFNKKRFYKNRFLWGRRVLKEQSKIALLPNNTKKSL